jgi:hypothetical protein
VASSASAISGIVRVVRSLVAEVTDVNAVVCVVNLSEVLLGGSVSAVRAFAATFTTIDSVILANSDATVNLEGLLFVDLAAQLVGNNFEAASVSSGGAIDLDVGVEFFAGGSEDGSLSSVEV